jgi:hypothetical protein
MSPSRILKFIEAKTLLRCAGFPARVWDRSEVAACRSLLNDTKSVEDRIHGLAHALRQRRSPRIRGFNPSADPAVLTGPDCFTNGPSVDLPHRIGRKFLEKHQPLWMLVASQ